MDKLKITCMRMYPGRVGLYVDKIEGNKGFLAKPVEYEPSNPHCPAPPTVDLSMDAAQQLIDQLWICGLRPTEGTGSAGSLQATEKHLSDMRVVAFNKLGLKDML